jgi:DNA polymerase-3 subunit delta
MTDSRSRGRGREAGEDPLGAILSAIAAGEVAPVYYLAGEPFPVEQVVLALRRAVLGASENAFNYETLIASETSPTSILASVRTMPMFGPRRLVQVRDAHLFKADDLAAFLPYLKDPSPSSCLLLIAEKADLRLKFFAEAKKAGVVAKFEPLKDRQVPAWVSGEARRQKLKLEPGAAERLAEAVGTDMAQLASALERLSLYAGVGAPLTPGHVEELLATTRQRSVFELTGAVGRGDRREALVVLRRMLEDRESGVMIVAMLARHLRQLWSAKELADRGLPRAELASALGVHPFFVGDLIQQAQRMSVAALGRTHRALFEADRSLKSSRLPERAILEGLVFSLCP